MTNRSKMAALPVSQSAVLSLRAIFSILMGLSVTNTLVIIIRDTKDQPTAPLADINHLAIGFALVLLFTIVRFYLGNVRHIDDFYVLGTVDGRPINPGVNAAHSFVSDFVVLLLEALLFSLASFYVVHAANFTTIVMALLMVDIVWAVAARGVAPHQRFWFVNNLGHFLAIAVCYGLHLKYEESLVPFYFVIGLLFTNGAIDFVGNRAFYFASRRVERSVFLSAPFTQLLDGGGVPDRVRDRLNSIIDHLEAEGWSVANAHKREHWGAALDSPYTAVKADLKGVENAGTLVAILGSPPSPGVQLEIGFALAQAKRIVLIFDPRDFVPYLIKGALELNSVQAIPHSDSAGDDHELTGKLSKALARFEGGTSFAATGLEWAVLGSNQRP